MNLRHSLLALLLATVGSAGVSGQIRNIPIIEEISDAKAEGVNQSTRLQIPAPRPASGRKVASKPKKGADFELYRAVVRKHTWYVGVGAPLSEEAASHLPYYYKFSMKNAQGHWQHLEALQGDLLTAAHPLTPYVLDKQNDTDMRNEDWRRKLKTVAQWIQIPDLGGNLVVEERAYDAAGNMVYSFIPVLNADGRVTGSYNDAWGMPADLREDSTTTYGSVVRITYDRAGRDSIIDYLDGQGLRKYNADGVDQQRYLYDAHDRLVQVTSHNAVGDYLTDNWGNCGVRYTYLPGDTLYTVTILGADLAPMRMPALRADGTQTYVCCEVRFDRWGRVAERIVKTAEGAADATLSGLHRIAYRYSESGQLQEVSYYDLSGRPMTEAAARQNH